MEELSKNLSLLLNKEVLKILDDISIDFSIPRESLDKYIQKEEMPQKSPQKVVPSSPVLCSGKTKKGTPCSNKPKPGTKFCGKHS